MMSFITLIKTAAWLQVELLQKTAANMSVDPSFQEEEILQSLPQEEPEGVQNMSYVTDTPENDSPSMVSVDPKETPDEQYRDIMHNVVLPIEKGWNPKDPSMFGILPETGAEYMRKHNIKNLRDLTAEDAAKIGRTKIYDKWRLGKLPKPVAAIMYDGIYQHGPKFATRYLDQNKAAVNLRPDQKATIIRDASVRFFNKRFTEKPKEFLKELMQHRKEVLRTSPAYRNALEAGKSVKGYEKRLDHLQEYLNNLRG